MAWGTVTVGGMALRETITAGTDSGVLRVAGQEAHPPKTRAHVQNVDTNMAGLPGLLVPVVFTDKAQLTGFFQVEDARSDYLRHAEGATETTTWQLSLRRVGTGRDVEIESTVPLIGRLDELPGTQVPVFWHAPAIGHTSYLSGAAVPSGTVDRPGADGVVRVYTGLPIDRPRWTIRADDYLRGAARIYFDTIRRVGTLCPPAAFWEIHNGLIRVQPGTGGALIVSVWDQGDWRSAKTYSPTVNGTWLSVSPGIAPELSILRNDPEHVIVRLTYPSTTAGRVALDLGLRRGARFLTAVLKRASAATLGVTRVDAEAASAVTGGLLATGADLDGNRYAIGSSRVVTTTLPTASIAKASVTSFDFFLGFEVDPAPQVGDTFADLFGQYLGSAGERVRVVRR